MVNLRKAFKSLPNLKWVKSWLFSCVSCPYWVKTYILVEFNQRYCCYWITKNRNRVAKNLGMHEPDQPG